MWENLDLLIGVIAAGYGILLLLGKSNSFRDIKYKAYDIRKLEIIYGVGAVALAAVSFLNYLAKSEAFNIFSIIFAVLDIVAMGFFMRKAKKKKK